MRTDIYIHRGRTRDARDATIYEKLREKLGREPTGAELRAEVARIKEEGLVEMAEKGKLKHQRGRR